MEETEVTIAINQGVARHPDFRMAEPVTLEICKGEQVAIVGPNAAGKTRLADLLTARRPLLGDEVHYDFLPTPYKLVSDNLKSIDFLDSYGVSDGTFFLQQRWSLHDDDTITFSSGELRKFQLSRVLKSNPRMLFIDNPFIGLDVAARQQLRDMLATLIHDTGLQVVIVVSRAKDIPDFITHVIPVAEGCRVMPKMTREAYIQSLKPLPCPALPQVLRDTILDLPAKDLSEIPFYQRGGEILNFNNVSIRYGKRTILNELSWTVHEGERWALSGPNGSGKTTLLSLVCADNPQAYACDIRLFGHQRGSGESIWQIKRHIGYVSPEMHRAYLRDLPAIDIVASGLHDSVGLYVRPRPEQRDICLTWMRIFGIEHLADRTFMALSSGEQRLCLLARAFVKDPELLILDEPLHGLDPLRREQVREIIDIFCMRKHKTLIVVTHYQEELPTCINRRLELQRH